MLTKALTSWWRHQMEAFSALLALRVRNSPVTGEFPSQMPVSRSSDAFFDLGMDKRLSEQSRRWWFVTLPCSLWCNCNVHRQFSWTAVEVRALLSNEIPHITIYSKRLSNNRRLNCLFTRLFRLTSKITSLVHFEGNTSVTRGFPSQRASNERGNPFHLMTSSWVKQNVPRVFPVLKTDRQCKYDLPQNNPQNRQTDWTTEMEVGGNERHYSNVIMSEIASRITDVLLFTQPFFQAQITENIKAPRHWPLWGEFHDTEGQ